MASATETKATETTRTKTTNPAVLKLRARANVLNRFANTLAEMDAEDAALIVDELAQTFGTAKAK